MATKYLIDESTLKGICDAVRSKNGQETLYRSNELANAISLLSGSGATEENEVTEILFRSRPVNVLTLGEMLSSIGPQTPIRIAGYEWSAETADEIRSFYNILDTFTGIDDGGNNVSSVNVKGEVSINQINISDKQLLQQRYPTIIISAESEGYDINYYTYDGESLIYTERVAAGGTGVYSGTPERSEDDSYTYEFSGWAITPGGVAVPGITENIMANVNLYAAYTATEKLLTVSFYNGDALLETVNVHPGQTAVYSGDISTLRSNGMPAIGFSPSVVNVQHSMNTYVKFAELDETQIADSWSEIIASVNDGTYIDKYKIGQYIDMPLGIDKTIQMQIVGMNCDTRSASGRITPISWMVKNVFGDKKQWDSSDYQSICWSNSTIRSWLNNELYNMLPEEIKNAIVEVKKTSRIYTWIGSGTEQEAGVETTNDKLWFASESEISSSLDDGGIYTIVFSSEDKRKKTTYSTEWWSLRDRGPCYVDEIMGGSAAQVLCVGSDGRITNRYLSNKGYPIFGFCF